MLDALSNLVPNPLHPALVHLPIALTVLVPVFAVGALIAIRRGARPLRAWGLTTALLATLSVSAWVSVETGEEQGERVEDVVPETALESHEEAAEGFLALSIVVLGIAGVGLLNGRIGTVARLTAAAGTLALVVSGYAVGHSGGSLVYEFGAANAYTDPATRVTTEGGGGSDGADAQRSGDDDDR